MQHISTRCLLPSNLHVEPWLSNVQRSKQHWQVMQAVHGGVGGPAGQLAVRDHPPQSSAQLGKRTCLLYSALGRTTFLAAAQLSAHCTHG